LAQCSGLLSPSSLGFSRIDLQTIIARLKMAAATASVTVYTSEKKT
jgi:hypothetical protein